MLNIYKHKPKIKVINFAEIDVKSAMTLALKSLIGQKIYVENFST